MSVNSVSPISEKVAAFIQQGVAIAVASSNPQLRGSSARATGCRISPDRKRISLIMNQRWGEKLLHDIHTSHRLAAVFCLPITEQALQIKSSDAVVEALAPGDWGIVEHYQAMWEDQLRQLGFDVTLAHTMTRCEPSDMVVVSFSPEAVFEQTPGPDAGRCFSELAGK
ncbi:MAG TPA: hypothetical protein VFM46_00045 [Pseudomonadales bacterium]|nr:hypothetical protein [Pseudomonadales bacterium]